MEKYTEEDLKKVELAIAQLDRQYKSHTVMQLGNSNVEPWPSVSTGALSLDIMLGIGGLPQGRIVEIYGPESSGKSTVALSVIGEAQRGGGLCAFIDAEHALDPGYAKALGVNLDELFISQPDYGEQAIEILDTLLKTGAFSVMVVDSVAALTPKAELDGDMESAHMGLQPRLMAKTMRKITASASEHKTLIIFINQLREKIGVMFGNPETTPGGRALKFAASVRIDLRKKEDLKDKEGNIYGVKVNSKIVKNKMAPPFKKTEFDIIYGKGVDNIGCVFDLAVEDGIIEKSGAWFSYKNDQLGQGRANCLIALSQDLELLDELKGRIAGND